MTSKSKSFEKNGSMVKQHTVDSVWNRAFTYNSDWPDKVFDGLHKYLTRNVICHNFML